MSIQTEITTLSTAIAKLKTEITNKGQTVSSTDTVASLKDKIEKISNKSGFPPYSKNVLNDVIEGTIETLYDTSLDYVRPYCFSGCNRLHEAYFSKLKKICPNAFDKCFQLETLILTSSTMVKLESVNALRYTAIESGKGLIYVTDSLVATYKADKNWSKFADYIVAYSTYPN